MEIEKAVRDYIGKTIHLSLATVSQDAPWVCELHFAFDDKLNLYFRSLKSRRHSQEIAVNPQVAGNIIDKYRVGEPVVGVYFEGKAELVGAGKDQELAAECLKTRLKIENDIVAEADDDAGHQFYKVTVANWYVFGRFGGPSGQKYKLAWNGGQHE